MANRSESCAGVAAIGTQVPGQPVSTPELLEAMGDILSPDFVAMVRRLGVSQRHSIVDPFPAYLAGRSPRNLRASTTDLAVGAARACLADDPGSDIGLVIAVTNTSDRPLPCLGYELMDRLKGDLPGDANVLNMEHQGCSALLKALDFARCFLDAHPGRPVLIVAAEGHTGYLEPKLRAHYHGFHRSGPGAAGEEATKRMLEAFLFGDGAVALLVKRDGRLRFDGFRHLTNLAPGDLELLSMNEGGLRKPAGRRFPFYRMSPGVPARGAAYAAECLRALDPGEADFYCIHTGSRKILDGVRSAAGIDPEGGKSALSYRILERYANLSSCSVGFMLAELFRSGARGRGVVLSFGVGFSASGSTFRLE